MPKTVQFTDQEIERGRKAIRGIREEARNLTRGLKAGTLDRKKLVSGLKEIEKRTAKIPDHPCHK